MSHLDGKKRPTPLQFWDHMPKEGVPTVQGMRECQLWQLLRSHGGFAESCHLTWALKGVCQSDRKGGHAGRGAILITACRTQRAQEMEPWQLRRPGVAVQQRRWGSLTLSTWANLTIYLMSFSIKWDSFVGRIKYAIQSAALDVCGGAQWMNGYDPEMQDISSRQGHKDDKTRMLRRGASLMV